MSEERTGTCRYCGQTRICDEDELLEIISKTGADGETALNICASRNCDCEGAQIQREREMKLEAAGAWIENIFEDRAAAKSTMLCATKAITERAFNKITIKDGKRNYTIDLDKDGCIRIKTKYTDTDEELF